MTWEQALEIVVERTRHERFRQLCSKNNPDAEQRHAYRRLVLELVAAPVPLPIRVDYGTDPAGPPARGCCGG
jgi:hypothetical protein